MAIVQFPKELALHPEEVRKVDPISQREECWVPGTWEGGFQEWRRFTLQRKAELSARGALNVLPIRYQDCIADFRSKLKKLFGRAYSGETYGELWAPLGRGGENITVQPLMPHAREAFLAWARQAGVDLNSELIQELFPECESVEFLGGGRDKCLIITEKTKSDMENIRIKSDREDVQRVPHGSEERLDPDKEKRIQNFIDRVEPGFLSFRRVLEQRYDELKLPQEGRVMRANLFSPFRIVEMNKANPLRNKQRQLAEAQKGKDIRELYKEGHFFFYNLQEEGDKVIHGTLKSLAAFSPWTRTLTLPENLDAGNQLDMLILYHELAHACQDVNAREHAAASPEKAERYSSFFNQPNRRMVDLNGEACTFADEIEVLNILLGNCLRFGQNPSAYDVARMLNARSNQIVTIQNLLCHAQHYYPHGSSPEGKPPDSLYDALKEDYVRHGLEVYFLDGITLEYRRIA